MCSEYQVTTSNRKIQEALGKPLSDDELGRPASNRRIKLSMQAPIVVPRALGKVALTESIFPVNPFPNSRLSALAHGSEDEVPTEREIRRIYETPMWKAGFTEHPVLVPMTGFFEPVYWGKEKGSVQQFTLPEQEIFFAAGIQIQSRVPKASGNLNAFTILTHTATKQMLEYHQRLVVILKPGTERGYLENMTARERFDYLIENRYTDKLELAKDRTMAKGWEKRTAVQESKLAREQAYLTTLKDEGTEG